MSKILTVVKYKLKIIMSDKSFIIAMALIPLFLTFITGYALRYEKRNQIPIAICDLDNSEYSVMLTKRISSKEGLIVIEADEQEAVALVKNHKAEAAFIIKEGFMEKILKGDTDGAIEQIESPSTLSAGIIARSIAGEAARLMLNSTAADWVIKEYENMGKFSKDNSSENKKTLWSEAWEYTDSLWEPEPPMKMDYSEIKGGAIIQESSPLSGTVEASALGMLTAFLMFLVLFNSSWLIDERENSTIKRLVAGINALGSVFAGNILTLLFIGIIHIAFFWLISSLVFKISIFNNPASLLIIIVYLLTVIALSLFISSILKTRMQLQTGAPLFSIITGFAGGCFWNFAEMSGVARSISLFTPQGLALELFRNFNLPSSIISYQDALAMVFSSWPMIVMIISAVFLTASSYIIIKNQY
ncbi:MAG TPA: ABC transporter permease [Clostridiaceae bacterium]|nr:ABC transporter permease [Clostridiaceae bacterium]